ncbi:MAG: GatB/YqeY domain-containing protein [Candidatus Paceibacterota bacterium]
MSIQQTMRDGIKSAMIAKDALRLTVLRSLVSAFTNELVVIGKTPQDELPDENAIAVIKRAVKQRKDSIDQFTKGGRLDLVENEQAELKILETFLPATMSKEDIKKIALAKKTEMNITDKAGMGKFMGLLMKELKGQADGTDVKEVVESLFN